jgi:hypothetical protein
MLSFAPDYDHLPLIAKVEVFDYALQNTEGNDLERVCIHLKYLLLLPLCINCCWLLLCCYHVIPSLH